MMAEVFDLTCCPSAFALESTLSRQAKDHHGLVPKLSLHGGKNLVSLRSTEKGAVFLLMALAVLRYATGMSLGLARKLAFRRRGMRSHRRPQATDGDSGVFKVFVNNRNLN